MTMGDATEDAPPDEILAAQPQIETNPKYLARLQADLGITPDDHISICREVPGGRFRATVVRAADAVAEAVRRSANGTANVWFGLNPVDLPVTDGDVGRRGENENVTRLVALVADLDLDGKLTSETIPEVAETLAKMLGTQPVTVTFTGHGAHIIFAVEQTVDADLADPDRRATAAALLTRFGRLVKRVARDHGGTADTVSDLARVSRVPRTVNRKFPDEPVPVFAMPMEDWRPISLDELRDVLEALGVPEYAEDREVLGAVVSDPHGWGWAKHPCGYAPKMIAGWSTDTPAARHPWLVGQ